MYRGSDTISQLVRFGIQFTSKNESKIKKLHKWPYNLARYAGGALSSTPRAYLEHEFDFESIELITRKELVKMLEIAIRAPDSSLKSIVFQDWVDYRNENSFDDMMNAFSINGNNIHNNTALSRAEWIKRKMEECDNETWYKLKKSKIIEERYAYPTYIIQYPSNMELYYEIDEICKKINNHNSMNWFTDGCWDMASIPR